MGIAVLEVSESNISVGYVGCLFLVDLHLVFICDLVNDGLVTTIPELIAHGH